ncbi:MAG: hypothetical protein GY710_02880 [Desulfobacteraceae bacterium]|nr:hypothetical protein [Desulfobacteraceae bacterium]
MKKIYSFSNNLHTTKHDPKGVCFAANFLLAQKFLNGQSISSNAPEIEKCIHLQALYNKCGGKNLLSLFQLESKLCYEEKTNDFNQIYKFFLKIRQKKLYGFYLIGLRFKKIGHMVGFCFSKTKQYLFDSSKGLFQTNNNNSGLQDIVRHLTKYKHLFLQTILVFKYTRKESMQYDPASKKQAELKFMNARNRSQNRASNFTYTQRERQYKIYLERLESYLNGNRQIPPNLRDLTTLFNHDDAPKYHTGQNAILDSNYPTWG